jgi:NDP-sugar pyrophosphorylase family protein
MKAMILAAGLGTRLRPLTNDRPKALVEIAGRTLLEITVTRLRQFGVREIIVNVHHFADEMVEYLKSKNNFGMRLEVSREDILLDTGGGIKKAAWFFQEGQSTAPFIVHNVDVISGIDLGEVMGFHHENGALATLAVQHRETSRYLLFDKKMQLCGRRFVEEQKIELARAAEESEEFAFTGIHVISPRLLRMIEEDGVFSIVQTYLRLAGQGERIMGYNADGAYWRDLGKPRDLAQAEMDLKNNSVG